MASPGKPPASWRCLARRARAKPLTALDLLAVFALSTVSYAAIRLEQRS